MADIKRCRVIDCRYGDGTCCQGFDIELNEEGKCIDYFKLECYKPDDKGIYYPAKCVVFNRKNSECINCYRKPYLQLDDEDDDE